jgi:hypothetical protein
MQIEYFADDCSDCPLILIYGEDPIGALNLRLAVERLAVGLVDEVAIHEIPGYSSSGGCQLFAKTGPSDAGVYQAEELIFECILRKDTWLNIVGLLEPFADNHVRDVHLHQYLNETGKISLLISTDRAW